MTQKSLLCSLTIISLCCVLLSFNALAEEKLEGAPVNPRFLSDMGHSRLMSGNPFSTGYRAGPITPETHRLIEGQLRAAVADSLYDLRDPDLNGDQSDSLVSPVKNQGACGSCWTFSTYGSLESHLMKTASTLYDFSEDNMKHRHGFVWGPCDGGNTKISSAYMARHLGPISEADDPYSSSTTSDYCTTCTPVLYTDNHIFLPGRSGSGDIQYLKQALLDYGAVQTSMFYDLGLGQYNSTSYTYYYSGGNSSNHGVTIVGWDDDKEVTGAPGNGAFIIKNSHGTGMGDNGFFYVSYYDSQIAYEWNVGYAEVDDSNLSFDTIYQYDPLGNTFNLGCSDGDDWGANTFTPASNGQITAIGLFLNHSSTAYEIYIYDDFNGTSFLNQMGTQSGSKTYAGYYTIPLDTPVTVTQNDSFSVVVRFNNGGTYGYSIPLENSISGYANCSANAGESYISCSGTEFDELTTTSWPDANVNIKAFVKEETCPEDSDGDGYGDPASPLCPYPDLDCDDSNPDVNPGETEGPYGDATCSDELDNDCDDDEDVFDTECLECSLAIDCDDTKPCTDDACVANFCEHTNNAASCEDGNICTTDDMCADGVCGGGSPLDCDDENECTDDTCDPATGCDHTCNATGDTDTCCEDTVCSAEPVCEELVCTDSDNDDYSIEGGDCGLEDCDDDDSAVNPGMTEIPENGKDDDCKPMTPDTPIPCFIGTISF